MKRFDLRHLGADFEGRMCEIIEQNLAQDEVGIFIFEIGDFSSVQKSANLIAQKGWTLMNSLRFNEVDWTIIVKKATLDSAKNAESSANSASCGDFLGSTSARFVNSQESTSTSEVALTTSSISSLASHNPKNSSTILEFASCKKNAESTKIAEFTMGAVKNG